MVAILIKLLENVGYQERELGLAFLAHTETIMAEFLSLFDMISVETLTHIIIGLVYHKYHGGAKLLRV